MGHQPAVELFKPARCPHHGGRETLPSRWGAEGVPQVRAEDRRPGISSPRGSDDWIWGHLKFPLLTDGLYSFLFGISPCMVFLSHGMEASPWTLRLSVASGSGWQDWQGLRCCLVWSWGRAHTLGFSSLGAFLLHSGAAEGGQGKSPGVRAHEYCLSKSREGKVFSCPQQLPNSSDWGP